MWKKLSILFFSLCFCLLPVKNVSAEEFKVFMYNQEMEKTIFVQKGDVILVQVSDNSVASYQCCVSDARIAMVSLDKVTAIGMGETTMTVLGYNENGRLCFQSMLTIEVGENRDVSDGSSSVNDNLDDSNENYYEDESDFDNNKEVITPVDMTSVTLDKKTLKVEAFAEGYPEMYFYNGKGELKLENLNEKINQYMSSVDFTYNSTNEQMDVSCLLYDNVITVEVTGTGITTLEITINGKVFTCKVNVVPVSISSNGIVLEKGKKETLKVKNTGESVKWTSSNKKIATVSSKGVVKAKKGGVAIITATVGEQKFGCAVNVVSTSMKKVVDNATSIAKGTYNQSKRMEEGYYDCSSLIWRSYSPIGKTFGDKNWAPVAANIGKWCSQNGTQISESLTYEDIQAKKLKVGDLLFVTGSNNGRYLGISHVEMFLGYACEAIDNEGNVTLTTMCPARNNGYGNGSLVLRPKK